MAKIAVLYDAGQAVLSTFDLDEVLQRILSIARDYFHLPNVAILLLDKEGRQLCVRSQIGWDAGKDLMCLGQHQGSTGAADHRSDGPGRSVAARLLSDSAGLPGTPCVAVPTRRW